jgi:hypothetical protein
LQDGHENIVGEMGWALEAAQSFHSNHFIIQHYSPEHILAHITMHKSIFILIMTAEI